jgi:hypothetical protein
MKNSGGVTVRLWEVALNGNQRKSDGYEWNNAAAVLFF